MPIHFGNFTEKAECKAPKFDGVIVSPMKSIYESGDKITISCEEGYELKGTNSSVCANEHGGDIFSYIRRLHGYGRFSPKVTSYTCVGKYSNLCILQYLSGYGFLLGVLPDSMLMNIGLLPPLKNSHIPNYIVARGISSDVKLGNDQLLQIQSSSTE